MAITITPSPVDNEIELLAAIFDSIRLLNPVWLSDDTIDLRWETLLRGPFSVYMDGVLVKTTYQRRAILHVDPDEFPAFDVLTAEETADLDDARSARLMLEWYASTLADYYRVQQYIDAAWVTIAEIPDQGQDAFTFVTDALADDTEHQFKVYPMRSGGAAGTELSITRMMIRDPDPPDVDVEYNDTAGTVTISAA